MVPTNDSRSPFFSLLSLTYRKALISSCFHFQTARADKRHSGCVNDLRQRHAMVGRRQLREQRQVNVTGRS